MARWGNFRATASLCKIVSAFQSFPKFTKKKNRSINHPKWQHSAKLVISIYRSLVSETACRQHSGPAATATFSYNEKFVFIVIHTEKKENKQRSNRLFIIPYGRTTVPLDSFVEPQKKTQTHSIHACLCPIPHRPSCLRVRGSCILKPFLGQVLS